MDEALSEKELEVGEILQLRMLLRVWSCYPPACVDYGVSELPEEGKLRALWFRKALNVRNQCPEIGVDPFWVMPPWEALRDYLADRSLEATIAYEAREADV